MITLELMLRAPQMYQEVGDAARLRVKGTANAAEEADAITKLSEWEGVSAEAATTYTNRTVSIFEQSKAADLGLAQMADVALQSATRNAQDIKAMLDKADAYPAVEVNISTNEVKPADMSNMHKEALDRAWRKYQEIKDEVKRILDNGRATDRQFASGMPEGGFKSPDEIKDYPIPDSLKPPVPPGKSENSGHWVFRQNHTGDLSEQTSPMGFQPFEPGKSVDGFDKPPSVGTDWFTSNKPWVQDSSKPPTVLEESYDVRLAGHDYTDIKKVIPVDGHYVTAQWVDNVYDMRHNYRPVVDGFEPFTQTDFGEWQRTSTTDITDLSKRFPTETFRYPIAQPWRFPEYNGMPSGGVVELANGAVKKVY